MPHHALRTSRPRDTRSRGTGPGAVRARLLDGAFLDDAFPALVLRERVLDDELDRERAAERVGLGEDPLRRRAGADVRDAMPETVMALPLASR